MDVVQVFDLFEIGYSYIVSVGIYVGDNNVFFVVQDFIGFSGYRIVCGFDDQWCFDVMCIVQVNYIFQCGWYEDVIFFFQKVVVIFDIG